MNREKRLVDCVRRGLSDVSPFGISRRHDGRESVTKVFGYGKTPTFAPVDKKLH